LLVNPIPKLTSNFEQEISDMISKYERRVEFYSKCLNVEKTHIKKVALLSYYYCSKCHDYHMVRKVT
jgi:hypothetical protein